MDSGLGRVVYDYDAGIGDVDDHGLNFGNVRVSMDDLERRLYSEYLSGNDCCT
jgi:hypothetical protein